MKKKNRIHLFDFLIEPQTIISDRATRIWQSSKRTFRFTRKKGRWAGLLIGGEFDPLARVPTGMLRDTRIAIVHCLVMGYLPAALLYAMRSGRRTVLVLQKVLACTREECEALAKTVKLNTRSLVIIGGAWFL